MGKYYVVKVGRNVGIYNTWAECEMNVSGYKGAKYKSFTSLSEANDYLNDTQTNTLPINGYQTNKDSIIYCDGGQNRMTGVYAYGSVVDGYGNDLIGNYSELLSDMNLEEVVLPVGKRTIIKTFFNDVAEKQNNGAELLSMIAALRISINTGKYNTLYSDSQTVISWSEYGTKITNFSREKLNYINELVSLRRRFRGNIIKISGNDNLADLGFHRS